MSIDLSEWKRCKWISSVGGYVFWYRASCADTLSESVLYQIFYGIFGCFNCKKTMVPLFSKRVWSLDIVVEFTVKEKWKLELGHLL